MSRCGPVSSRCRVSSAIRRPQWRRSRGDAQRCSRPLRLRDRSRRRTVEGAFSGDNRPARLPSDHPARAWARTSPTGRSTSPAGRRGRATRRPFPLGHFLALRQWIASALAKRLRGAYIGVRGFDPIVFENDTCSLCVHRSLLLPYNTNVALA